MYFPSFLVGGSSFIHLLASHPRVVATFGLGTLLTTILWSPFGTPNVPGTAGQLAVLEQRARAVEAVDPTTIQEAQEQARLVMSQSTRARLGEIIDQTLGQCGVACTGVDRGAVLNNPKLLHDVLLLHALDQAHADGATATAAPNANVPSQR